MFPGKVRRQIDPLSYTEISRLIVGFTANAEGNALDMLTCGRLFGRKKCKSEWKRHEHGITTDVWMEYLAFYRVFKLLKHIFQAS